MFLTKFINPIDGTLSPSEFLYVLGLASLFNKFIELTVALNTLDLSPLEFKLTFNLGLVLLDVKNLLKVISFIVLNSGKDFFTLDLNSSGVRLTLLESYSLYIESRVSIVLSVLYNNPKRSPFRLDSASVLYCDFNIEYNCPELFINGRSVDNCNNSNNLNPFIIDSDKVLPFMIALTCSGFGIVILSNNSLFKSFPVIASSLAIFK